MTIIRAPRSERYTVMRRATINDGRLSFRALGLLTYILDKPDDWRIEAQALSGTHQEGRDAVRTALTELETAGYLTRRRYKNDKGQFSTDSIVSETGSGQPALEIRCGEPGAITNTVTEDCKKAEANASAAANGKSARPRNVLLDALIEACGLAYDEMTKRALKTAAVASSEIATVGATPDEVHRRASNYRARYEAALTPSALASQWAACASAPVAKDSLFDKAMKQRKEPLNGQTNR